MWGEAGGADGRGFGSPGQGSSCGGVRAGSCGRKLRGRQTPRGWQWLQGPTLPGPASSVCRRNRLDGRQGGPRRRERSLCVNASIGLDPVAFSARPCSWECGPDLAAGCTLELSDQSLSGERDLQPSARGGRKGRDPGAPAAGLLGPWVGSGARRRWGWLRCEPWAVEDARFLSQDGAAGHVHTQGV